MQDMGGDLTATAQPREARSPLDELGEVTIRNRSVEGKRRN
jgi:hypothetical protein